jgi:hypothetical protein
MGCLLLFICYSLLFVYLSVHLIGQFPGCQLLLLFCLVLVLAGYTKKSSSSYEQIKNAKFHRVMNKSKQTGDSALVQSKGTKTIH